MSEQILIGLHMSQQPDNTYTVAGLALTDTAQTILCRCVVVNHNPSKALKAALARLSEKLYLARHIPSPELVNLSVYAKPQCRPYLKQEPVQIVRSHWTITEARRCLIP
jgi:hypothetical protein